MNQHLNILGIEAKSVIAFMGLFHTSVGSLAIGLAFVVTVAQIAGYRNKIRRYDLFAKRTQLFHVCIYNVGTINAIGLVFALSGLFPQFWEQLFTHFFWPLIIEEVLFFLLATTVTFHYFFWEKAWGHKKFHIAMGAMLTPLFFLQVYLINGVGGFMLTPGAFEPESLTQFEGILGYDLQIFYNPSFLMLQAHRTFANVSYAAFFIAGWCGFRLFQTKDPIRKTYYEDNARLSFYIGFAAFLAIPVIGYFYSLVLKNHADEAFWNLMLGAGDVIWNGIDIWWVKQVTVAIMLGAAIAFAAKQNRAETDTRYFMPKSMLWAIGGFYLMFYMAMGMVMTWAFFWWSFLAAAIAFVGGIFGTKLFKGSGRLVFLVVGVCAFFTVLLGGYAREASRPRFVDRIADYDEIYRPSEQGPVLMVEVATKDLPRNPGVSDEEMGVVVLVREACSACHGVDRVQKYRDDDWSAVVGRMVSYGARLNNREEGLVVAHLEQDREIFR